MRSPPSLERIAASSGRSTWWVTVAFENWRARIRRFHRESPRSLPIPKDIRKPRADRVTIHQIQPAAQAPSS